METITVAINHRMIDAGTIVPFKDRHGNDMVRANRTISQDTFDFYTRGAARLWVELDALVRGK